MFKRTNNIQYFYIYALLKCTPPPIFIFPPIGKLNVVGTG
jgi:hypothetical protein